MGIFSQPVITRSYARYFGACIILTIMIGTSLILAVSTFWIGGLGIIVVTASIVIYAIPVGLLCFAVGAVPSAVVFKLVARILMSKYGHVEAARLAGMAACLLVATFVTIAAAEMQKVAIALPMIIYTPIAVIVGYLNAKPFFEVV